MTERHHFLVSMLDGMDKKVSIIWEKFKDLEQRVNKLAKNEHTHRSTAASMYHETIQRQSVLDKFTHLQDNQRSNNINYTKEQKISKFLIIFVNNHLYKKT